MSWSDGLIRNVHSLPPTPDNSVILGLVATPSTIGIFASAMIGMVASVAELQWAPMIAVTFASASLLATLTASEGLQRLSYETISICFPSTPPALLISSRAISTPHLCHIAAAAAGPVSGALNPIRIDSARAPVAQIATIGSIMAKKMRER